MLVGKDKRLREAHRESVDAALKELERYTQARIGGDNPAQTTGKFIAAKFEHDSSRPDRTTGYAAPQLHTHTVIFNMTRLEDGRTKPVQPLELYRSQQYATAIYRAHLAEKLQKLYAAHTKKWILTLTAHKVRHRSSHSRTSQES